MSEYAKTLYFSRRHSRWSWVRLTFCMKIEPGHHWHYNGLVRRDTFSIRGVGLVLQRLVKEEDGDTKLSTWHPTWKIRYTHDNTPPVPLRTVHLEQ